jgi:hypothetical protein
MCGTGGVGVAEMLTRRALMATRRELMDGGCCGRRSLRSQYRDHGADEVVGWGSVV